MYQEAPEIRWDRVCCVGVMAGALGLLGWMTWRIAGDMDAPSHALEFVAAALALGLLLYFAWLTWALTTVRYILHGDRLVLRQALSLAEIPLTPETHLYRWRHRWVWDGALQRDLNVAAVRLFPPFWVWREEAIWVLAGRDQAVAFRPSPRLLAELKSRVRHTTTLAG